MISSRYAPAVLVLVCLALIPTIIHSYAGVVVRDDRRAASLPAFLAEYSSRPSGRNATWGQRRFESDDWIERVFSTGSTGAAEVTLTVVRSFDLKALYHHPELAVAYGTGLTRHRVETFGARENLPIHVLDTDLETGPVVFYALQYDQAFVRDPIWFQIRTAGELLVGGRRAMTLFFVQTDGVPRGADLSKQPALTILLAAVDAFVAQAPSSDR